MIEIPLKNKPEQIFNITISDVVYDIRVLWNTRNKKWSISISQAGIEIVNGVGLVGGIDIFKQYNIALENGFTVNLIDGSLDPDFEDFGTGAKLFLLTDEEVSGE